VTGLSSVTAVRDRTWWTPLAAYWLVRITGFAIVAVVALAQIARGHRMFVITVLAISGALMIVWGVLDWRDQRARPWPAWPRMAMLCGLAAAGGAGAALSSARELVWFAVMAVLVAGNDLPSAPAVGVTAVGVLGIELGGLAFGFSASNSVGWPMALVVALLAGQNRRDGRIRSAQAATLIARTRQAESEQRRAAALEERSRVAREIHDVLAHSLSALRVQIETAQSVLTDTGDLEVLRGVLDRAGQLTQDGLTETKRAIHALRAGIPPLPDGLARLAANHEQDYHDAVDLVVTGQAGPMQPGITLTLLRVAREALTNAARHAPGASVTMTLAYTPACVTLTISNLVGSSAQNAHAGRRASSPAGCYGLAGMRERLQHADGTVTAGREGYQWIVRAQVPS
jgi:signal transduction histidine kinase